VNYVNYILTMYIAVIALKIKFTTIMNAGISTSALKETSAISERVWIHEHTTNVCKSPAHGCNKLAIKAGNEIRNT